MELARVKWRRQVEQPPFLSVWLLLRGTAVLLLHTRSTLLGSCAARCSCCSTIARPSALPAWTRFTACEVASAYSGEWSTIAAALECARPQ